MGVTRKNETDEGTARVLRDCVGEVGLVRHENDRSVRSVGNGQADIRMAGRRVVETTYPETITVFIDGDVLIDQNGGSLTGEDFGDQIGVDGYIMIAEDGVTLWSLESGDDLSTAMDGVMGGKGDSAMGDEVSGEEDEIG